MPALPFGYSSRRICSTSLSRNSISRTAAMKLPRKGRVCSVSISRTKRSHPLRCQYHKTNTNTPNRSIIPVTSSVPGSFLLFRSSKPLTKHGLGTRSPPSSAARASSPDTPVCQSPKAACLKAPWTCSTGCSVSTPRRSRP